MAVIETRSRFAAARGHQTAGGLAILCILANGLFLALNDTLVKLAFGGLPVGEVIVLRGFVVVGLLLGYLATTGQLGLLKIHNRRAMALYCLTMVLSTHLFLQALTLMPLGDAAAITYASPIFTTALAVLVLGEKVGWRRWIAVGLGFIGVVFLLTPSGQGYSLLVALLPLSVAVLVSLRDIVSRRLSLTDASVAILTHNTLWVAFSGFARLPFETWVVPAWGDLGLVVGAALLLGLAQYLIVEAYRLGELSLLMPFRYMGLVFAGLCGFLVWGDVPTWTVATGAAIVAGSGLFIWHRERLRRSAA